MISGVTEVNEFTSICLILEVKFGNDPYKSNESMQGHRYILNVRQTLYERHNYAYIRSCV